MGKNIFKCIGLTVISLNLMLTSVYAKTFSETLDNAVKARNGLIDYSNMNTEERFKARRAESPEEWDVIMPFENKGEYTIYVSPDGNDRNRGTVDSPLKTVDAALNRVAQLDAGVRKKGVTIYLRKGEYTAHKSFGMNGKHSGAKDMPLFISSYNNENVEITSSDVIPLKDFKPVTDNSVLQRFYPDVRDKIVEVNLKDYGITEYGSIYYLSEYNKTYSKVQRQLYLDNEQLTLARYPNNETLRIGQGLYFGPMSSKDDYGQGFEWTMADDVPLNWVNTGDIGVLGYFSYNYNPDYHRVISFDREKMSARCAGMLLWPDSGIRTTTENTYYFYNVLEELDSEGEWFLDKYTGKLYLYPPEYAEEDSKIYLSTGENNLFEMKDTENVIFNGITFKNSAAKGINAENGKHIVVQNCKFSNLGSGGVYMTSCFGSGVTTSYFNACKTKAADLTNGGQCFIQNCMLEGGEMESKFRVSCDCGVMSHNFVMDSTHGVFAGSGLNWYLEYNESVGGNKLQGDGGEFYTGGVLNTYMVCRYNYFHHPRATAGTYGRQLYFDEGGSNAICYNNIMQGGDYGSFNHNGKEGTYYNNIFVDTKKAAATSGNYYGQYVSFRQRALYTHSFSWWWMANAKKYDVTEYEWIRSYPEQEEYYDYIYKHHDFLKNNPTTEMGDAERWLLTANYFCIKNNILVNTENEINSNSLDTIINENNVSASHESFKDFSKGDFTVTDENVLKQIPDYEQIPMEKIGLIKDCDMWRNLKMGECKKPSYPKSGYENRVSPQGIFVSWQRVSGAPFYKLIVAEDENFEHIVLEQEVNVNNAKINLEPGKRYYFKVIATAMSRTLDYAESESPVSDFYTMTVEEANSVMKAEKKELRSAIAAAQRLCEAVIEGEQIGQYPVGTKQDLQMFINSALKYMEETNIQGYIDSKEAEVYRKMFDVQKNVILGNVVKLSADAAQWEKVENDETPGGQAKAIKIENGSDGLIVNSQQENAMYVKNKETIPYGSFAVLKIKPDNIDRSWSVLGGLTFGTPKWGLNNNNFYSIILSKDGEGNPSIEFQCYKAESKRRIFLSYVNNGEIKANDWNEIAVGTIPYETGTRFVFIANGKVIYDYYDEFTNGCYYTDSYFMFNRNEIECQSEFAESDLTYDEIMNIINSNGK